MTPSPEPASVWTYEDLGLLLGSLLPCMLLSSMLERLGRMLAPAIFSGSGRQALAYQTWLYLMLLGVLYLLAVKRHRQPLWKSLAWITAFPGAWWCVFLAPLLVIVISTTGQLLHAPPLLNPAGQLLAGGATLAEVGIFATLIGPAFEELFFRGFLQTLLTPSIKAPAALLVTALLFALLHGAEYEWNWQHLLLIFGAGSVFGFVRLRTGSTAASTLLHMSYNLTLFVATLAITE